MAITSKGYDGPLYEADHAKMSPKYGAEYWVDGGADWRVTAVAGQDRTVSVAAGTGGGRGVKDVSDLNETLALDAVAVGGVARWDLIALRRDWQPVSGGPSAFVVVKGTSAKAIPGTRINDPGVQDDQPIALCRVTEGSTTVAEIVDLRCWFANGSLIAKDDLARSYLNSVGTHLNINGVEWTRTLDANNLPQWEGGPQRMYRMLECNGNTQSGIPANEWTTITNWAAAANSPTPNESGIGYSSGTITIPRSGRWHMSIAAAMGDYDGVNLDRMDVLLRCSDGQTKIARGVVNPYLSVGFSKDFILKEGDTVTAQVKHNSGTIKGLHSDPASQWWDFKYIGPA